MIFFIIILYLAAIHNSMINYKPTSTWEQLRVGGFFNIKAQIFFWKPLLSCGKSLWLYLKIHTSFFIVIFILLTCVGRCYGWLAYSSTSKLCRNLERVTRSWLQLAESQVVYVRCHLLHNFSLTATSHNVTSHFARRSVPSQRQWLTADVIDCYLHRRTGLCGKNRINL